MSSTAFSMKRTGQIRSVIHRLMQRIINAHRCDITPEDLFELYVRHEDRGTLTRVFDLVQLDSSTSRIAHNVAAGGGDVGVQIYIDFSKVQKKWLVPKYARNGMIKDANPEILAKVTKWIDKRVALGVECGLVGALFEELNWRCTAGAMAFFMPSVSDFLDMLAEDDKKAAAQREKIAVGGVPDLPQLPLGMDEALDGISATVARARLMDRKSEDRPDSPVRISLSSGSRETPWGTSLTVL